MSLEVTSFGAEPRAADLDAFLTLPYRVYADDPRWVPPFRQQVAHELTGPPILGEGHERRSFLARREGEPVARATAVINPLLREGETPVGLIGYFEAKDDAEAAGAVLDAARAWLAERGRGEEIWGPMNSSIWQAYRFMTKGFERPIFFGEPYNPDYYPRLWTDYGFERKAGWYSWDLSRAHLDAMHAASLQRRSDVLTGGGYRYDAFQTGEDFDRDLRRAYDVLVPGFSKNLAYTHLDFPSFAQVYGGMRAFVVGDVCPFLVDAEGTTIGMGFLYPDPGDAFRALGGDAARLPDLPALLKQHRSSRLIFHTMAVLEPYRAKGLVEAYLTPVLENAFSLGLNSGVGALAKEGPTLYHKTGEFSREYLLYRYAG